MSGVSNSLDFLTAVKIPCVVREEYGEKLGPFVVLLYLVKGTSVPYSIQVTQLASCLLSKFTLYRGSWTNQFQALPPVGSHAEETGTTLGLWFLHQNAGDVPGLASSQD